MSERNTRQDDSLKMEKIHILLPVHNRREITRNFIKKLKLQIYTNYHLVLIDDGSTDGTATMVRNEIKNLTVLKGDGNLWWAGALQQGYRWLQGNNTKSNDIVLMINDDTVFDEYFLKMGHAMLQHHPKSLILAAGFDRDNNRMVTGGIHIDWKRFSITQASSPNSINCLSTRGLFLRYGDLKRIGGFRPFLLPHYYSDYEFTHRAFNKGYRLIASHELKIWMDFDRYRMSLSGDTITYRDYLKYYFSKKNPINPVYSLVFILIACPWKWKLLQAAIESLKHIKRVAHQLMALHQSDDIESPN